MTDPKAATPAPHSHTPPSGPGAGRSPIRWVPTLYFAQGVPFFVVMAITTLLFNDFGMSNAEVTKWQSALGWAWVVKPLWSPFLEALSSKKRLVVIFQALGAVTLACVAFALNLPGGMPLVIAILAVTAFASATHDIASDGLYIASLTNHQQAEYAGWQGAFFNVARLFAKGGLLVLVDWLALTMTKGHAWSAVFAVLAATMAVLALYHVWALPDTRTGGTVRHDFDQVARTLVEVVWDFLRKPGIAFAILFILLFRAGEGQLQSVAPLFLRAATEIGGLGLSKAQIGIVYGTAATIAFVFGSVVGGYFTAWAGLKRAMPALVLVMNLPNLVYWWLSSAHPTDLSLITAALSLEMFGYGFGFVGCILFIMQVVAPGRFPTAHYALGSGVMQLGFVLSGTWSGAIQTSLGYEKFFLWTVVSAVPVLLMSFFVPTPKPADAGASDDASTAPAPDRALDDVQPARG
jgi:PAT family beta-lactamase induction signal transducer AmpG